MTSPIIRNMIEQHQYAVLTLDIFDLFVKRQDECVLFFTEDPARFPESNDVAMILPELVKEYSGRFLPAVIDPGAQRELQTRYGFSEWPTLVFLRRGRYLGAISRVRDWAEYLQLINDILDSEPSLAPGFAVAVEQPGQSYNP